MKKLVSLILCMALLLISLPALAQIDLSSLSFDELLSLNTQVVTEITSRAEWKEVTVPAGVYEVGVDIPVGYWTISASEGFTIMISCGNKLNSARSEIPYEARYDTIQISHPTASYYQYNPVPSVSWNLNAGDYVVIEDGAVIFTPYLRPALGF